MWANNKGLSTPRNSLNISNSFTICRLCMLSSRTSAIMQSIFETTISTCIADKIASVTRMSPQEGDGLPELVCQQCIFQLNVADLFIQRCIISDRSLKSLLAQGHTMALSSDNGAKNQCPTTGNMGNIPQSENTNEVISGDHVNNSETFDKDRAIYLEGIGSIPNIDIINLPEHVTVDGFLEENDEHSSETAGSNMEAHPILSVDPLLGFKVETDLDSALTEEINGQSSVKIEVPDFSENLEYSADGNEDRDSYTEVNVSITSEQLIDPLDENELLEDEHNYMKGGQDDTTPDQSIPNRPKLASEKYTCFTCVRNFSTKWTLSRHMKSHKRLEIPEKLYKVLEVLKNSSSEENKQSNSKQSISSGQMEQLKMTPIVKITRLVTTNNVSQRISETPAELPTQKFTVKSHAFLDESNNSRLDSQKKQTDLSAASVKDCSFKPADGKDMLWDYQKNFTAAKETNIEEDIACLVGPNLSLKSHQQSLTAVMRTFRCVHCIKSFRNKDSFTAHLRAHSGNMPYKCQTCGKVFETCTRLKVHSIVHSNVKQWKCGQCGVEFKCVAALKKHEYRHKLDDKMSLFKPPTELSLANDKTAVPDMDKIQNHQNEPLAVQETAVKIANPRELHKNQDFHASGSNLHKCLTCGKVFKYYVSMRAHSLVHTGVCQWKCEECNVAFKSQRNLMRHVKLHCHMCVICSVEFSTKESLAEHTQFHRKIIKELCEPLTVEPAVVHSEVNQIPLTSEKEIVLDDIGTLQQATVMNDEHADDNFSGQQRQQLQTEDRPFNCLHCDETYRYVYELREHLRCHTGEREFKCRMCNASFNQKFHLRAHMQCHSQVTWHKCQECALNFKEMLELKAHILTHAKTKSWQCGICMKSFKLQENLKRHKRKHNYRCAVCSSEFKTKGCLLKHTKNHEKPVAQEQRQINMSELLQSTECHLMNAEQNTATSNGLEIGHVPALASEGNISDVCAEKEATQSCQDELPQLQSNISIASTYYPITQLVDSIDMGKALGDIKIENGTDVDTSTESGQASSQSVVEEKTHMDQTEQAEENITAVGNKFVLANPKKEDPHPNPQAYVGHQVETKEMLQYEGEELPLVEEKYNISSSLLGFNSDHSHQQCGTTQTNESIPKSLCEPVHAQEDTLGLVNDLMGHTAENSVHNKPEYDSGLMTEQPYCDIRQLDLLKDHVLPRTKNPLYKCDDCSKTFNQKYYLRRHMKVHINKLPQRKNAVYSRSLLELPSKPAQVIVPQFIFQLQNQISIADATTSGKPVALHPCDLCGNVYMRKRYAKMHRLSHDPRQRNKCPICGKMFNILSFFKSHMASH